MIYLDNAATSFPKPECVYEGMERCMREYCANPGRGGHKLSVRASKAVLEVRNAVGKLFNISNPMQLCFTKNATEALNMAIKGIAAPGSHVITTAMEHNSVIRPLRTMERDSGIESTVVDGNRLGEVSPEDIKKSIKRNTALIVCTLSSNVNGVIMPVAEIGRIAREAGITFLVDASQGAGSISLDTVEQNIDMLAFPGHKGLMGPQGTGCLYVGDDIKLKPLMQGGTGSNSDYPYQPEFMPDLLESGTLNTPGIVGLGCGIGYINHRGIDDIRDYKHKLVKMLYEGFDRIPGITQYSAPEKGRNSGIVAINLEGMDSTELSYALDREYDICTRAGFHCSPGAHRILGTGNRGVVRFSIGCLNTEAEIASTIEAVERIARKRGNH
ncbi:MAG: aminotransferase class V-fold PLP-dependent enzyme [Clostridiaceae bacterium]